MSTPTEQFKEIFDKHHDDDNTLRKKIKRHRRKDIVKKQKDLGL